MPSHQINEFNSIKTNNDFKFMKKKCQYNILILILGNTFE
jgi:hypothetical protein